MTRLGILISGRGSNLLAIADAIADGTLPDAEIAVVLSNKAEAAGVARARERGFPTHVIESKGRIRAEHDADMVARLREYKVDLVCLAGYMRVVTPIFVDAFPQRLLNMHPSLLPAFPGLHPQQQALDYGVRVAGTTVHFVDEELDHGVIIVQRSVPVLDGDDAQTLAARILEEEHTAYSEAIARVLSGRYEIRGRCYVPRDSATE